MVGFLAVLVLTAWTQEMDPLAGVVRFERLGPIPYSIEGHRLTFECYRDIFDSECHASAKLDGKLVARLEGYGGQVCFKLCCYPTPWPVFLLGRHSAMGHGQDLEFYAIQNGKAKLLLKTQSEHGGPVFRDFDGDGVMEWVFDDDSWYRNLGEPAENILVYKVNGSGGLDLWKKFPNKNGIRVAKLSLDWF